MALGVCQMKQNWGKTPAEGERQTSLGREFQALVPFLRWPAVGGKEACSGLRPCKAGRFDWLGGRRACQSYSVEAEPKQFLVGEGVSTSACVAGSAGSDRPCPVNLDLSLLGHAGIRVLDGPLTDSMEAVAFNKHYQINDIYSCRSVSGHCGVTQPHC